MKQSPIDLQFSLDISSFKDLLQVLCDHQVSSFKCKEFEIKFDGHVSSTPTESIQTESIQLTDDLPSEDELLFAASGFAVNRE